MIYTVNAGRPNQCFAARCLPLPVEGVQIRNTPGLAGSRTRHRAPEFFLALLD
jgi:hypothetical protein